MQQRIQTTTTTLIACLAALLSAVSTSDAAPSVAFVARQFVYLEDYESATDLRKAGLEVGTLKWDNVSMDTLKPFHAIVLTDIPPANERGRLQPKYEAACAAIDEYCHAGGGVLACMGAGGWDKCRVAANVLLKHWNAQLLDEQVTDPDHLYKQTRYIRWWYSWTTNVADSPITEGVRTVYFPARPWRADGQKTLYAPQLSDDWQVLVRGEKSAHSVRNKFKSPAMDSVPATYAAEPPIAAVREVGRGRAAILAIWPNWTFWGARHRSMESIVWERGVGGLPSDTGRFCVNMVRWLAAKSPFGGYKTPENPPTRPEKYPGRKVDWAKEVFPNPPAWKHYRVLAGARTSYTGGQGTVAEYCRAARAAGYQAVLFAERLEDLTPANWNKLREECKRESTADFLALPGLDFRTLQGDEYVAFGEFNFPKPPGLAADGKHIDDTYNFWGSQMHHGFIAITRLHRHPDRDPQILKNMPACAVHTYENGRLVDDSLKHYLALNAQFHNLVPLALHLVDSPAKVEQAAATGLQNVWRVSSADDLREQITPHRQAGLLYWLNPHRGYLTSGPKLEDWQGLNVMYWGAATPGSDRAKLKFSISSPAGVKEVEVSDRGQPHMRFANEGDRCEREFPTLHDHQHVFHLLATDRNGGKLLSPGIRIRFSQAYANQCGDHQNTISSCLQPNRKGRMIYTSGTTGHVYAGWIPTWTAPCALDPSDEFPPSWDGVHTGSSGKVAVAAYIEGGVSEGGREVSSANLFDVAGPEVQILSQIVRNKYPPGTPQRRDCAPSYRTVPMERFTYTVRRTTPTARFERAGISFNEITITAQRDFTFSTRHPLPLAAYSFSDYGSRPEGIGDHTFVSFADGRALTRVGIRGAHNWTVSGDMELGNYMAAFPNPTRGAGAVFPLTPVRAKVTLTERLLGGVFGLACQGRRIRKGDILQLRFMGGSAPVSLEQGNQAFDDIRRTLGIGCEPAYSVRAERGRVEDTTGRLLVSAQDGAFAATLSKTRMPTDLFVETTGLQTGWSAAKQTNAGPLSCMTVHEGTGYTTVDLNPRAVQMVVGHPVTCTDARVRLVTWWTRSGLDVYSHNPTDGEIACSVRANAAFHGLPNGSRDITLPAGGSVSVSWRR